MILLDGLQYLYTVGTYNILHIICVRSQGKVGHILGACLDIRGKWDSQYIGPKCCHLPIYSSTLLPIGMYVRPRGKVGHHLSKILPLSGESGTLNKYSLI